MTFKLITKTVKRPHNRVTTAALYCTVTYCKKYGQDAKTFVAANRKTLDQAKSFCSKIVAFPHHPHVHKHSALSQKGCCRILAIPLSILNRFSQFFHCLNEELNFQQSMCNIFHQSLTFLIHYLLQRRSLHICHKTRQNTFKNLKRRV